MNLLQLCFFLPFVATSCATLSIAQDGDKAVENRSTAIAEELKAAVKDFAAAESTARDELNTDFNELISKTDSNKKLPVDKRIAAVEELQKLRDDFLENGKVPGITTMSKSVNNYHRAMEVARKKCLNAYNKAINDYDKAGDRDAAKIVIQERDRFQKAPNQESILQADMVFEGPRVSIVNGVKSPEITTVLTIRNVNDKKFYGNILIKAPGGDRRC